MSFQVKGWCPGALRPMRSGDGLVLRIRARNGRLLPEQIRAIADLSAQLGNGLIDLTNRANLQLRGLDQQGHEQALTTLAAHDLLDPTPEAEARRNIILSPFAPVGSAPWRVATAIAAAMTADDAPQVPAKFGFAIDTLPPVLHLSPADIRLTPTTEGWLIQPDGGNWALPAQSAAQAAAQAMTLAHWFLEGRSANHRMRQHLRTNPTPPSSAIHADHSPFSKYPSDRATSDNLPPMAPGQTPQGWLLGFAFGQITAEQLARINAPIRLTPWRMLLIESPTQVRIPGAIEAPGDPLLRSAACTGAPGCPQALAETRDIARELAPLAASLHVSGCAKGCARRTPAAVTLVATGPDRFDLIADGTTADAPLYRDLSRIDLVSRLAQGKAHDASL